MPDLKPSTVPFAALAAAAAALTLTVALAASERVPPGVVIAKADPKRQYDRLERGRYMLETGACHDCHTPGYTQREGKADPKDYLVGDSLGWQGPWGTTYAPNLRTMLAAMSEDEWVAYAKAMQPRPPMPWFNVRAMSEQDLRAIHFYVKSLGPAGEPAPAFVPSGGKVAGPVVKFPG